MEEAQAPEAMETSQLERTTRQSNLMAGWTGIAIAGGVYPLMLVGGYCAYGLIQWMTTGSSYISSDTQSTLVAIYLFTLGSAALFAMGFLWSGIVSMAVLAVLKLFNWTMRSGLTPTFTGGFAGGIVGFLLTWMIWELIEADNPYQILRACIGPGLATVMGQFGGARAAQISRAYILSSWNVVTEKSNGERSAPRNQFSLRQIFVFTAWVCVLLSLMRLFGEIRPQVLGLFAVWFVYQAMTLTVILRWILPWWDQLRTPKHRAAVDRDGGFT